MTENFNEIIAKSLGSSNSYAVYTDRFDSSLLNPMPRSAARERWQITGNEFVGVDVWHCYESTFLLENGCPIAGTLKFIYDSSSEFMVESKSMKLYLNSFDMCRMGSSRKEASKNYIAQIKNDLEYILQTEVQVSFFDSLDFNEDVDNYLVSDINSRIDVDTLTVDDFEGRENHIRIKNFNKLVIDSVYCNALRSRCRHTKQKDTGTAIVSYNGMEICLESLFKQIVSLREVNEFHEFCSEKMFLDIINKAKCNQLVVALLYSRRGSLDINPVRATSYELLPSWAKDVSKLHRKSQGQ